MLTDKIDKDVVINISIHSAEKDRAGIGDTADRRYGRLRDRGDGIIIVIDSAIVSRELHTVPETGEFADGFAHLSGIAAKELRADGVDKARVELVVFALELHVKVHRIVVGDHGFGCFGIQRGHIVSDEKIVAGLLVKRNIGLGAEIFVHGLIVIQMLLIEIEEDRDVRRYCRMGELMAGHLEDNDGIVCDGAVIVQRGQADIAYKKRRPVSALRQHCIEQGRGRALALGARDADDLAGKLAQEQVSHGSKLVAQVPGHDAGALDDVIVGVLVDLIAFSLENREFCDVAVFVNEFLGGLALEAVAPEKDSFAF